MIREFYKEDIDIAAQLYIEVFAAPPWNEQWQIGWATERIQTVVDSPGFLGYVYEEEKSIFGAVIARTNSFRGKLELEIVELFVSPPKQSMKIGSNLLTTIEESARQKGYSYSILLTGNRTPAFDFYLKLGYKARSHLSFLAHAL